VLLDIGLPGMDGLEALRSFDDQGGIPIIFLTARRRELDEVLGLKLGAQDYITKPFDQDVLLARIEVVLRRVTGQRPPDQDRGSPTARRW
jgi:DNA-binding response OmpR family regulator